jgi:hypothetical protein
VILILSNAGGDLHVDSVCAELSRGEKPFLVLDPAAYPNDLQLSVATPRRATSKPSATLRWANNQLDLNQVRCIWIRRPGKIQWPPGLSSGEQEWATTEAEHLFRGLWTWVSAKWVSEPDQIRRASLKLNQLRVAQQLGFKIPRTIVTNRPAEALDFVRDCRAGVVVKSLALPAITYGNKVATLYTHRLTPRDLQKLPLVSNSATLMQEFIPKTADIRVTVIGRRVFPVAILPNSAASEDFRRAEVFDLRHEPIKLPVQLSGMCRRLVSCLGLKFGAIDLLKTKTGEYVFLEINPNGQWLWLEWATGLPLSRVMATFLSGSRLVARPRRKSPDEKTMLRTGNMTLSLGKTTRQTPNDRLGATRVWFRQQREHVHLHIGDLE